MYHAIGEQGLYRNDDGGLQALEDERDEEEGGGLGHGW